MKDLEEIPQLNENAPVTQNRPNHTILQEDTMDITDCLDQSNTNDNGSFTFYVDVFFSLSLPRFYQTCYMYI
jgi:hypothetical protein